MGIYWFTVSENLLPLKSNCWSQRTDVSPWKMSVHLTKIQKNNGGIPAWTPQVSREKYPHPHIHHTGWEWYPVSPVLDCNPNPSLNKVWLKISRNPPISLQVMVKSSFWTLLLLDSGSWSYPPVISHSYGRLPKKKFDDLWGFNPISSDSCLLKIGGFSIPSGNLTVCYWKWPSRNSGFSH